MKLFFVFPLSGPNNGVKVISNFIFHGFLERYKFILRKIDTAQANNFNSFGKFSFKKVMNIFSLLKKIYSISNEDVVYLNITPKGFAYYRDLILLFCCFKRTENITLHIHANGLEKKISFYNRHLFAKSKIIVINKRQMELISPFCDNVFLVPNALPDNYCGDRLSVKKELGIRFIFISNLSKEKGVGRLRDICKELSDKNVHCELNVFGGALSENDLLDVRELGLRYSFFKYNGPISDEKEKNEILKESDVLLFLSDENYEVYPLVYIEALMNGLPIISTNQVVIEDLLNLGVASVIGEDLSGFDKALSWLGQNEELISLKEKCRETYLKNYCFEGFMNKIENIIVHEF
ncbi:glycosyltransferase [Mangrovimonas xylaniphaga]|uniref:glycosyltransferase n=1 Tax=Mangrovimonas xylaniphaga TaxID=1645915 RepID=UPI0006B4EDD0|nr:glycosyltransferase [Mangrovimonas xylaniphaga]